VAVHGNGGHEEFPFRETAPDRAGHGGGAQAGSTSHCSYYCTRRRVIHMRRAGSDHPGRSAPFRADRPKERG
jgi:hypothetical protein